MIFGKIIAGILGYMIAGPFGALLGVVVGHNFDRGLARNLNMDSSEQIEKIRESYFSTMFSLMGQLAKADGRVDESEIAQAEQIMAQMGVAGDHRQQAIAFFKAGARSDYNNDDVLETFVQLCGRHHNLKHSLLVYLITIALADGDVHQTEHVMLQGVAAKLGFNAFEFERLVEMVTAQHSFAGSGGHAQPGHDVGAAYRALGLAPDCSDAALKRAYRQLMSQHHPDKLIARGVPEDMLAMATEKTQEIQAAYELLKKHRSRAA